MQKEIDFLGNAVNTPERPFVAILGGAKVADKLNVISNLLEKCDTLIIGGGMAFTFLKAKGYEVGNSLVDDTKIDYCKEMMDKAEKLGKKLLLPIDTTIADGFPNPIDAEIAVEVVASDAIPADKEGLDIGTKTAELYADAVKSAKQLYGTDRWVYSRTQSLQKVPLQLQNLWQRQMLQQSSVVEILQQLLTSLDMVTR